MKVNCKNCGKIYTRLEELQQMRSLGLLLVGRCPRCDELIAVSKLWKWRGEAERAVTT